MNEGQIQTETTVAPEKHSLFRVTKLSKYLAMTLFVLLPFIGGWIGYQYAPEKEVYVDRVVYQSESKSEELTESDAFLEKISIGQEVGGMILSDFKAFNNDVSELGPENIKMFFEGPITVTGTYQYLESEIGFSGYCMSEFSEESLAKLPYVPAYLPLANEYGSPALMFCFRNEEQVSAALGDEQRVLTLVIDNYELQSFPTETMDWADFVGVAE